MEAKQYDATKVALNFAGAHTVRGYGADAMFEVEFDGDFAEIARSADGGDRHVVLANAVGTITVTLRASSPTNAVFSQIHKAGFPVPVAAIDLSSNADVFFSPSVILRSPPPLVKGKSDAENVWVWQFIQGKIVHSGSGQ